MSRFPKRLHDDGRIVTVDLHGCSVPDAVYVIRRCIQEAYRRGRAKVDVIHGASTSPSSHRTIKNEFLRRLDAGQFEAWTSGYTVDPSGGRTTVWMQLGTNHNPARIEMKDVVPP